MKNCPYCRQKIDYIAIKTITTKINYFGGVFRDEEIKEEVVFICPQCQGTIYVKKDEDEGKLTEIAKRVWQSLSLKK